MSSEHPQICQQSPTFICLAQNFLFLFPRCPSPQAASHTGPGCVPPAPSREAHSPHSLHTPGALINCMLPSDRALWCVFLFLCVIYSILLICILFTHLDHKLHMGEEIIVQVCLNSAISVLLDISKLVSENNEHVMRILILDLLASV